MSDSYNRRSADLSQNNKFSNLANIDLKASEKTRLSSGINSHPIQKQCSSRSKGNSIAILHPSKISSSILKNDYQPYESQVRSISSLRIPYEHIDKGKVQNKRKYNLNEKFNKKEVQSIIFDSKVERFDSSGCKDEFIKSIVQQIEQNNQERISDFKSKVSLVNSQIEDGINNLQSMIKSIKIKKQKQKQKQKLQGEILKQSQLSKQAIALNQSTKQTIKQHKQIIYIKKQMDKPSSNHSNQEDLLIKQAQEQEMLIRKRLQSLRQQENNQKEQEIQEQLKDSVIDLKGVEKGQQSFPTQYVTFINRLAKQILMDMQFTTAVWDLVKNSQLAGIKSLILKELVRMKPNTKINETFFDIQPSQIDPLEEKKPYFIFKYKEDEQREEALKLFNKYQKMQDHFDSKLKQRFPRSIIKILIQELARFNFTKQNIADDEGVTIGHLLSYLNMRTDNSFRNRFFVKMMKRLGLKANSTLGFHSLQAFIIV